MIATKKEKVCIVGLGYVGLTLAVYLSRKGLRVHGVDISNTILNALSQKKAHFFEKNFDAEISKSIDSGMFSFSNNYIHSDGPTFYIVTVGTPLGTDNKVNISALKKVVNNIAKILSHEDVIVLRSTVKVGTTRNIVKPILDKTGKNYHLGFCPERTLEGAAFEELSKLPQIVSGIDDDSLDCISNFFQPVCNKIVKMNCVEEAEMVKLLNNSERDLKFALSNEIALMSEAKGLDAYRIIEAANFEYPRSNIKKPGPVGGPCLEKDPYILTEGFLDSTYNPGLFLAARKVNEMIIEKGLSKFLDEFEKQTINQTPHKIAVLGFAFKGTPVTGDIRGSLVHKIIAIIKNRFPYSDIFGHDYLATNEDMTNSGATDSSDNIQEALKGAEIVIIQNNHPNYKKEDWLSLANIMSDHCMIYDFWHQIPINIIEQLSSYYYFGGGKK
ncbi:MAG: nucleotide sugar dehydrogenase [Legionellales bacterium]|nr:nucleotide sugar dehydrogenase [Legionellales bacterium]